MPKATDTNITTAAPDVPRTLRHSDTDEQWRARSVANKIHVTAVDAAHRLRGLAHVHYAIALCATTPVHSRPEFVFLASSVNDIALALERATDAQLAEWNAEISQKALPKPRKPGRGRTAA